MQTWIAEYFWWILAVECFVLMPLLVFVFTGIGGTSANPMRVGILGGLGSGAVLVLATACFAGKASLLDGLLITVASVVGVIIGLFLVIWFITKIMWR